MVTGAQYLDPKHIISSGEDGRVLSWSLDGSESAEVLVSHVRPVRAVRYLSALDHIVFVDSIGEIWSLAHGNVVRVRKSSGDQITALHVSPEGKVIAIGTNAGKVTVYDTADFSVVAESVLDTSVHQIRLMPHQKAAIALSESGQVSVIRAAQKGVVEAFPWKSVTVSGRSIAIAPDGSLLSIMCTDGSIWFYSLTKGWWFYSRYESASIQSGAFTRDGRYLVTADEHGVVAIQVIPSKRRRYSEEN